MEHHGGATTVLDTNGGLVARCPYHGGSNTGQAESGPRAGGVDWSRNDEGRATAMTLLVRMQGWGAPWLRVLMWFFRRRPMLKELRQLSFVHFAHWSVLDGLAVQNADQVSSRRDEYLLFESNFNGPWHEYIEAFCQVLGGGIKAILAACEGFPGLVPVRGFKPYMENHEFVTDHYYSAYPQASTTMVRAALELGGDMVTLRKVAAKTDDARFTQAWEQVLKTPRVQANLAGQACTLPGRLSYLCPLVSARKNVAGKAYAFIALTPIEPGQADRLRAHLRDLPRDNGSTCDCQSPLAKVSGTHFGRWVVLDSVFHDGWPEQIEVLDPAYLLFTAVFDVTGRDAVGAYLDELLSALGTEADAIWGCCSGWPTTSDRGARISYLRHHQRDANFLFAAYPGSVTEVRRALADRMLLVNFAQHAQTVAPDQLRAAFVDRLADADRSVDRGGAR